MKTDKNKQVKNIIQSALNRYDADELLVMLFDATKKNKYEAENLRDKMIELTAAKDFIVIPVQSLEQQMKIEDFIKSNIYTTYNEQQTLLNFF